MVKQLLSLLGLGGSWGRKGMRMGMEKGMWSSNVGGSWGESRKGLVC